MNVITTVNGVDLDRLNATIGAVVADPALGRFEFRARNRWIDGGHSRATVQGFFGAGAEDSTREKPFVFDVRRAAGPAGAEPGAERRRVRPCGPRVRA